MAYAFNDDKSKYDLQEIVDLVDELDDSIDDLENKINSKFVIITGSITGVGKNTPKQKIIYDTELRSTYGIEDLDDYVLLGATQKITDNYFRVNAVTTLTAQDASYGQTYPYIKLFGPPDKKISIAVFNDFSGSGNRTIDYELVLMKK